MAPLVFTCPNTKRRSTTKIATDAKSLAAAWKKTLHITCPHCGEVHKVSIRDAYIQFAVQDGADPIVIDRSPDMAPAPPTGFIPRRPNRIRQSVLRSV